MAYIVHTICHIGLICVPTDLLLRKLRDEFCTTKRVSMGQLGWENVTHRVKACKSFGVAQGAPFSRLLYKRKETVRQVISGC